MTLQTSGAIQADDINLELERASNSVFNMNAAPERLLAGVPGGAYSFSNFYGKSYRSCTHVHTSGTTAETANFGATKTNRGLIILAVGGNNASPYTMSCLVNGVSVGATVQHSSGDGAGGATATAMFVAVAAGTSGFVQILGHASARFFVLRTTGYSLGATAAYDSNGAGIPPWAAVNGANALMVGLVQNITPGTGWTGLTNRFLDYGAIAAHWTGMAFDINVPASGSRFIDVTASDVNGASSAILASYPAL